MSESDGESDIMELLKSRNRAHADAGFLPMASGSTPPMRTLESGATRSSEDGKLDYEGFISPLVLRRYAEYMNKNRVQADGLLRTSDNWQKGMAPAVWMKSMWRHFMDVWMLHRGYPGGDFNEALCALLFNVMGYLHERLTHASVK